MGSSRYLPAAHKWVSLWPVKDQSRSNGQGAFMIFGFFGKKKREEERRKNEQLRRELKVEKEALETELELLEKKLNVELESQDGDRTTTLSRYPRRIVELRIRIDAIDRKIEKIVDPD